MEAMETRRVNRREQYFVFHPWYVMTQHVRVVLECLERALRRRSCRIGDALP